MADGAAAVETNGNVLIMASPGIYQQPPTFLEWNGSTLTTVPTPSTASSDSSWYGDMLELPNGQILFSDLSQSLQVWTPAGTYQTAWQPTISSVSSTLAAGATYPISGTQFNGLTQGAYYGDDQQMATNYPLVRIVNAATGHVFYCRTHGHSSMGVATGSTPVSTNFDVPSNIELGASTLYVVANGIPSAGVATTVGPAIPGFALTGTTASVQAGGSGSSTVTQTAIGGFNSAVTLSVSGLPTGVSAVFSPPSITGTGTSTLTFTAASTVVAPATSTVTVTGTTAAGTTHSTSIYLSLSAAPAGTLSWSPASYNFGTLTSTANSFTPNAQFSLTNTGSAPVTIKGISISPGGEFVLNGDYCTGTLAPGAQCQVFAYFTPSNQPPGVFTGSLIATDSALNSPQTLALSGTGSASGFNITANDLTVGQGSSGSDTVTQTVQGGFNAPVTLTASFLPTGVSAVFNPSTIVGAGTSTLTFAVSSTAAPGSYGVMLVGTSASTGITQVHTITLTVANQGSPGFSLSAPAASVTAGGAGSSVVTESITHGFNSPVTLSASGLPSGVSAAFSPASITGAGSSTLTFNAAATAVAGTYSVTVTGTAASGATQTATIPLTVKAGSSSGSVTLSPASYNFGNVTVNGYSTWQAFTLTNTGSTAVSISQATVSGPFDVSNACGSSLAAGSNCTVWVLFAPQANGAASGTLTLVDNAGNSPQTATLTGTGSATSGGNINYSGTIAAAGQYAYTPNFSSGAGPVTATLNVPAGSSWRFAADDATANQVVAEQDGTGPLTITFTAVAGGTYNFFIEASAGAGAWSVTGSHP
ncbi:beta strand repeat-containing protein [Dyella silvatica]|uniref:beta strand repeat-containing protein n=1 Tax=Dyella silvatica TaxID=2992128 RepID=UPI002251619B|nr:choice-of-anchor D domain-containing protein [Dyella silvatica]